MSERAENPTLTDDQKYELYLARYAGCEADLRRFIRSLLPSWQDVDEVLQQTALVAWRKFEQYDPDTNFIKWACVIARFEALSHRRKMARDRLVFREDVFELMASEAEQDIESGRADRAALEHCLSNLDSEQRDLLTEAYSPGIKMADLADRAGVSAAAFYMKLKRLRSQLMRCIDARRRKNQVLI
ncbi:MAG: sigma-70 family RNA polymerase sigma factor [Verrucomicrobiota bacterium]